MGQEKEEGEKKKKKKKAENLHIRWVGLVAAARYVNQRKIIYVISFHVPPPNRKEKRKKKLSFRLLVMYVCIIHDKSFFGQTFSGF